MVSGGTTTYYQKDHLSVRMTSDANGNVLGQQGTYPFGELWYSSNGSSEWEFTTYQQDQETGLEYAMARYYDPRTATFCSADPVEGDPSDPESFNRYAYARNNPVILTDPSGQSWISWLVDAFVAIVAIATNQPELLQIIGALGSVAAIPIPNGGPFPGSTPPTFPGSQPTVTWEQLAIPGYISNLMKFVNPTFPNVGSAGSAGGSEGDAGNGTNAESPQAPTFTKRYLPSNAQRCSAILQFYAPPSFNLLAIVNAGHSKGLAGARAAVGQYGTFDFQRVRDSAGNTTFYTGYTPVANVAVGAYLYGAGYGRNEANLISDTYAFFNSSNGATREQAIYRNLGWDLAKARWNPSCKPF